MWPLDHVCLLGRSFIILMFLLICADVLPHIWFKMYPLNVSSWAQSADAVLKFDIRLLSMCLRGLDVLTLC